MKAIPIFLIAFLIISACSRQGNNNATADTATAIKEGAIDTLPDTLCYRHTEGLKNQDTMSVRFIIRGNEITGDLLNVPHEKDSRRGTIRATRQGNIIKGLWLFAQEGMQDTLSVEFQLKGDTLMQKNYSVDKKTGREFLSSTSAFTKEFQKIDCSQFPKK